MIYGYPHLVGIEKMVRLFWEQLKLIFQRDKLNDP
jgi:hypothetical protein